MAHPRPIPLALAGWVHRVAAAILGLAALTLAALTLAGAAGLAPTLALPLRIGATEIPDAGLAAQAGLLLLLVAILAVLPGAFRVMRLERTHRDFGLCLSDVAEAYRICHAADRADTFGLASEYEAVKARILFLQAHPDLGSLEPDILEQAAKMSFASRELAQVYSDEAVARARGFLRHREEEIALFEERIARARDVGRELRRRLDTVTAAEAEMDGEVSALRAELGDLLGDPGWPDTGAGRRVVALNRSRAAE